MDQINKLLKLESAMMEDLKEDVRIMEKSLNNSDNETIIETQRKLEFRYRLMEIIEADLEFYRDCSQ